MTTDPKALPGADPHTGNRHIDPVTGYDTTGHDWGGIRELNTPFPRIAAIALALTVVYSVITWILLPAWPLGRDYTRGVLGLDQGEMALERHRGLSDRREGWMARFETSDLAALADDAALMATAMPAANRLFLDNCSGCHGAQGAGGPGFPALNDDDWLWGGDAESIAETLRVGINSTHQDTRYGEMPSFDWIDRTDRHALAEYVSRLPSGEADPDSPAAVLFEENCAACHGDGGHGGLMNGAPSLADDSVIYGQDVDTVMETLRHGRSGHMPHWSDRLSAAEIGLLAIYVTRLSDDENREEP